MIEGSGWEKRAFLSLVQVSALVNLTTVLFFCFEENLTLLKVPVGFLNGILFSLLFHMLKSLCRMALGVGTEYHSSQELFGNCL